MGSDDPHYTAFISYRHTELDRKWAAWLHRSLERYRLPGSLVRTRGVPRRLGRIFRDEEELAASADLSSEINSALEKSRFLIVICSPNTPASKWVNAEIQRFRYLGRGNKILALLVEGEPKDSFPPALVEIRRKAVDSEAGATEAVDIIEPLAADVRDVHAEGAGHIRWQAKLRLIAALLEINFDDLVRRDAQRRNAAILVSAIVALALAAIMGALSLYALGQRRLAITQRDIARGKTIEAQHAQLQAQQAQNAAEASARESKAVSNFLARMIETANPNQQRGENVTLLQAVTAAVSDLDAGSLSDQPAVEAHIRETVGQTLDSLGQYDLAEKNFRRALALRRAARSTDGLDLATTLNDLATALQPQDKFLEAEKLLREALDFDQKARPNDPATATDMDNLALVLQSENRLPEAEQFYRKALAIDRKACLPTEPQLATSINNLATLLQKEAKLSEAEDLYRESLLRDRLILPKGDPRLATDLTNLGTLYQMKGKQKDAEPMLREAVDIDRKSLPKNHPHLGTALNNLGMVLFDEGDYPRAEALYREALAIHQQTPDSASIAPTEGNLAAALWRQGKLPEAEKVARQALTLRRATLDKNDPEIAASMSALGSVLQAESNYTEAESLFRESLSIRRMAVPPNPLEIANSLTNLAANQQDQRKFIDAEAYYREAIDLEEKVFPGGHPNIALIQNNLGQLLQSQDRNPEAEILFKSALEFIRSASPVDREGLAMVLGNLGTALLAQGKDVEAAKDFAESLSIRTDLHETQTAEFIGAEEPLALIYFRQKKYKEAEPLELDALTTRRQKFASPNQAIAIANDEVGLAMMQEQLGQTKDAAANLRDALVYFREQKGASSQATTFVANTLAHLLDKAGLTDDALRVRLDYHLQTPATTSASTQSSKGGSVQPATTQ